MHQTDRVGLFESLLDTFLTRAREKGYIVLEVLGHPEEFVQFQMHSGRVYGEVGARQWSEPERPLGPGPVAALGALGFAGGGPERNHRRDGLPANAAELARLADALLRAAYELPEDFDPVVREMNLKDVTMPRAKPFTRDMIETHLRAHDVHFLRDEDGDFRVEFHGQDRPGTITVWLVARGDGDTTYTITATADGAPLPRTRAEALSRCNRWNNERCLPKAFVVDQGRAWYIRLAADLPLESGIHQQLLDGFTELVIGGILEFWSWLVPVAEESRPERTPRRRSRQPRTDA